MINRKFMDLMNAAAKHSTKVSKTLGKLDNRIVDAVKQLPPKEKVDFYINTQQNLYKNLSGFHSKTKAFRGLNDQEDS